MAFVCTAPQRGPYLVPVARGGGYALPIDIGYDDDAGIDYTLLVGLDHSLPGEEFEFFFCIIETDVITEHEYTIWSGKETCNKFSRYDRSIIRSCLLCVTEHLIRGVTPDSFSMTTHDENLPEGALEKFRLLNDIFRCCGYAVSERGRRFGNHSWRMERV